jgi:hypothetical protein
VGVVIYGRVEDAASREPVEGVRIFASDSSAVVYTDARGAFALVLRPGSPLTIHSERLGFLNQQFDLVPEAASRMNVLLIEQAPIEIEGIDVVTEQAITTLVANLATRRKAYPYAVYGLDKTWLERFAPKGTPYEVARTRVGGMRACASDPYQLCVPGRGASFSNPNPTSRYRICVDGWEADVTQIQMLSNEDVALIEIFKGSPKMINVYTVDYMLFRARNKLVETIFGC